MKPFKILVLPDHDTMDLIEGREFLRKRRIFYSGYLPDEHISVAPTWFKQVGGAYRYYGRMISVVYFSPLPVR